GEDRTRTTSARRKWRLELAATGCTGLVPDILRNVGERGRPNILVRTPVAAGIRDVVEHGSTDRNRERIGGKRIYGKRTGRDIFAQVVAPGRSRVSRRNCLCNALRGSLLIEHGHAGKFSAGERGFTDAVTDAHHVSNIVIDNKQP